MCVRRVPHLSSSSDTSALLLFLASVTRVRLMHLCSCIGGVCRRWWVAILGVVLMLVLVDNMLPCVLCVCERKR